MTLPHVSVPKLTGYFKLALAVARVAEFQPLAEALFSRDEPTFHDLIVEVPALVDSISQDIRYAITEIDSSPTIFASGTRTKLSATIISQFYAELHPRHVRDLNNSIDDYVILRRFVGTAVNVLSQFKLLTLQDLSPSSSLLNDVEQSKRFLMEVAHSLTLLQVYFRWRAIRVFPENVLTRHPLTSGCNDDTLYQRFMAAFYQVHR